MAGEQAIARTRRQANGPRLDEAPSRTHPRPVNDLGRSLLVIGLIVAAVGGLMMVLPKMPWLGHLPGDIHIERDSYSVHVPIVTCLVVSAVATILLNFFFRR